MVKSRKNHVENTEVSKEEIHQEPEEPEEPEEPALDWKVKRSQNLADARKKASELRAQIREVQPEVQKEDGKLKKKLTKLKDDKKVLEMEEKDDGTNDTQTDNVDTDEPIVIVKKKERKKKVVIVESSESDESEDEPPVKVKAVKKVKEVVETPVEVVETPVIEEKPTFQRGADGVWYF
jgi:hypothetical protein